MKKLAALAAAGLMLLGVGFAPAVSHGSAVQRSQLRAVDAL